MPRTKRPVKRPHRFVEGEVATDGKKEAWKKLEEAEAELKKKIDERVIMEVGNIELAFKILMGSMSQKHLQMTVGELRSELYLKGVTSSSGHSARSASHDDGYMTEGSSQGSGGRIQRQMGPPSTISRSASRRSRSADSSRKQAPRPPRPAARRRSNSTVYRTPACNNAKTAYPAITPKVALHTPLSLLRRPRDGEMVVSMTGSPIMVPSCSSVAPAHCDFQLTDGTVLSLQPQAFRQSQQFIPLSLMDSNVIAQLQTLKENLDKVVKLGKMNLK